MKIILDRDEQKENEILSLFNLEKLLKRCVNDQKEVVIIKQQVKEQALEYLLFTTHSLYFSTAFLLENLSIFQKYRLKENYFYYHDQSILPVYQKLHQIIPAQKGVLRVRRTAQDNERNMLVTDLQFLEELFGQVNDFHLKNSIDNSQVSHLIASFTLGKEIMSHYELTTAPYLKANFELEFSFKGGIITWNGEKANPFLKLTIEDQSVKNKRMIVNVLENARSLSEKVIASLDQFHHLLVKGENV